MKFNTSYSEASDIWTREKSRLYQFYELENMVMEAEINQDFPKAMRVSRAILRLQMEVMSEPDPTNKRRKIKGVDTEMFKELKSSLDDFEERWLQVTRRSSDPAARATADEDQRLLVNEFRSFLDRLFFMNTVLGLNYKQTNIDEDWAE